MKKSFLFFAHTSVHGLLLVIPIYLAVLLLLKAMKSLAELVRPLAKLVPEQVPAEHALSLLLVLLICFSIGVAARTRKGQAAGERMERAVFGRIPGYSVIRSLTHQVAGDNRERIWKPAFAEIEEALVPAYIIEEFEDGRYTVFVPSVPTPLAGGVYILDHNRVHPVETSFAHSLAVITRWGSGAKDLVMSGQIEVTQKSLGDSGPKLATAPMGSNLSLVSQDEQSDLH
jgi:uncharacterized membrane protein